jgi:hypothetical protein
MVMKEGLFEQIMTTDVLAFLGGRVQRRGLAPKTANSYWEILYRLFNGTMEQQVIWKRGDKHPVINMQRYKELVLEI